MAIAPGTRLGAYEITALIGAGGMGEVYRARDSKLNRDVALKVLPDAFTRDPDRLARFTREAHLLASLNHPHIGAIYGLEDGTDTHALVLELVEGDTLADRIAQGPIPLDDALSTARQICDALQTAHDQGIVHRDLKPSNIKITPDDLVKVLDFGLAKLAQPDGAIGRTDVTMSPTITSPALMTGAGVVLGTAAYMSPEQAKGREADKRSDIWAFGCVLYEMLTGRRAFDGEDMTDVLGAVVRLEPDWQALPADVSPLVRTLLQQCLVKDRRKRIADIAAARFVLNHAIVGTGGVSGAPVAPTPPWQRAAILLAAALAIALLAGAAVWFATRPEPPRVVRTTIATSASSELAVQGIFPLVAITPDGSRIVYQGNNQLLVRALEDPEPTVLVRRSARFAFVSPDGQWVGFFEGGEMKKVAITGGPPETIATIEGDLAGATWGPDGTIVFATAALGKGLHRVAASGGTPVAITTLAREERAHYLPVFLPGGEAVLFTIFPAFGTVDETQIAVLDLRTGTSKVLFRGGSDARYVTTGHLVYNAAGTLRAVPFDLRRREVSGTSVLVLDGVGTTRIGVAQAAISGNGSLVYIPGAGGARRTVASVDRKGQVSPLSGLPPDVYRQLRVSPNGTRLAFSASRDIWIYDFDRSTRSRLTTDPGSDTNPVWTPDGQRIIFTSHREGYPELFWRPADGTGRDERLLTRARDLTNLFASGWSKDGRQLLFNEVPANLQAAIGHVAFERPDASVLVQGSFGNARAAVNPDGRWMAYETNATGRWEIVVERYPELGNRVPISTGGGRDPRWSSDGRELFFSSEDGQQMFTVPVQSATTFLAGRPQVLFEAAMIPAAGGDQSYDVAPDGRFLIIRNEGTDTSGSTAPSLELVQNWTEELKRLVPAN